MGGWKQKEESSLLVPSTFLFLYQPSVCLCVSRVRAYLTTNQHPYLSTLHRAPYSVLVQKPKAKKSEKIRHFQLFFKFLILLNFSLCQQS
jgi:hypothetical protein